MITGTIRLRQTGAELLSMDRQMSECLRAINKIKIVDFYRAREMKQAPEKSVSVIYCCKHQNTIQNYSRSYTIAMGFKH